MSRCGVDTATSTISRSLAGGGLIAVENLTLANVATALNGAIGYDKGTVIVQKATATGRPLRDVALEEGVDAKLYDETIDLRKIARGNQP